MFNVLDTVNSLELIKEYFDIEKNIVWTDYGHKGRQTGLQYKDEEDPWTSAVGIGKIQQNDYIKLNPAFLGTSFKIIIEKYNLKRTRLMWVNAFACYSLHHDDTERLHVPLVTNPDCLFIFQDHVPFHLPIGQIYKVDATKRHSFANFSDKPRLHLVGNL